MNQNQSSETKEQELQTEGKKKKKSGAMMNALLIGAMIGILIYSAVNNSLGFFTLIPLYFIYRLVNQSKKVEQSQGD